MKVGDRAWFPKIMKKLMDSQLKFLTNKKRLKNRKHKSKTSLISWLNFLMVHCSPKSSLLIQSDRSFLNCQKLKLIYLSKRLLIKKNVIQTAR